MEARCTRGSIADRAATLLQMSRYFTLAQAERMLPEVEMIALLATRFLVFSLPMPLVFPSHPQTLSRGTYSLTDLARKPGLE